MKTWIKVKTWAKQSWLMLCRKWMLLWLKKENWNEIPPMKYRDLEKRISNVSWAALKTTTKNPIKAIKPIHLKGHQVFKSVKKK